MKTIAILGVCLLAAGCANQHAANACFVQDVKQATRGDWSGFVLPKFLHAKGAHAAGEYQLPDCTWAGRPYGPQF